MNNFRKQKRRTEQFIFFFFFIFSLLSSLSSLLPTKIQILLGETKLAIRIGQKFLVVLNLLPASSSILNSTAVKLLLQIVLVYLTKSLEPRPKSTDDVTVHTAAADADAGVFTTVVENSFSVFIVSNNR